MQSSIRARFGNFKGHGGHGRLPGRAAKHQRRRIFAGFPFSLFPFPCNDLHPNLPALHRPTRAMRPCISAPDLQSFAMYSQKDALCCAAQAGGWGWRKLTPKALCSPELPVNPDNPQPFPASTRLSTPPPPPPPPLLLSLHCGGECATHCTDCLRFERVCIFTTSDRSARIKCGAPPRSGLRSSEQRV